MRWVGRENERCPPEAWSHRLVQPGARGLAQADSAFCRPVSEKRYGVAVAEAGADDIATDCDHDDPCRVNAYRRLGGRLLPGVDRPD